MKSQPLVSICIPTHNRTEFLLEALKSCFAQTYKNYEIIITDNSNTNDTKKAVSAIGDKRIRYYKNKENIGSFNNLIKLTTLTKGKYIKFLLDDDLLDKECLQKMVVVMEQNHNIGIVCAPLQIIDDRGRRITPRFYLIKKMVDLYRYKKKDTFINRKEILRDFLTKKYPCCVPSGIMYRQECFAKLGTFDEKFRFICDVELCMRFATEYDFYYIDSYLSSWRYTPTSETIAILHKKGVSPKMFYELTRKYLNKNVLKMFTENERAQLTKDSYLFASKRMILNIVAGLKSGNVPLIINTLKIIHQNDPYIMNKLKLPFVILGEVLVAFIYNSMVLFKLKSSV